MKYLSYTLALCLILSLGFIADYHNKEIRDLKKQNRLLNQEIGQLRADMKFHNQNAQRVIDEVRHSMSGKNFIPVYDWRTFLVYDVEEMNANKDGGEK